MRKNKLWYINSSRIFSSLTDKHKEEMASSLTEMNVRKREFIYNSGDKSEKVYILKEGGIRISRMSEDGRELTVDILGPGDIFGELSLTGETERETDAVATEDSHICAISRNDLENMLRSMPDLSLSITKWIGLRLKRIESRFEKMLFQDAQKRLISVLSDLAEKFGQPSANGRKIMVRLSHKDLAELIGASRETVTLEINKLKRNNELFSNGKYFILP